MQFLELRSKFRYLLVCTVLLASWSLHAQMRHRSIPFTQIPFSFDSVPIFRHSVSIYANGKLLDTSNFSVDTRFASITRLQGVTKGTQLEIYYQRPTLPLNRAYAKYDTSLLRRELIGAQNPFQFSPNNSQSIIEPNEGLKVNGNLMRGLGAGNNQSVVLNSNLNLQIQGKLQNEVNVLAAVSDESNPIQPEGNTQQLQDFDKVFLKFYKQKHQLTLGDFEMRAAESAYFTHYFKKSRGISTDAEVDVKSGNLHIHADAALSRGRFVRNTLSGIEGNQGPFRLTGPNGEVFIVIVSGTETVYLDGQKMNRGEQNDYTMDYNSGEITFMPRRVITQYSRIVVEFQYSDRNYARTILSSSLNYQRASSNWFVSYFTEQDDRNQPLMQTLSDSDKTVLSRVGDQLNQAIVPSALKVNGFSNTRVLYRKIDSLGYPDVYVQSLQAGEDTVFYDVRFTYVGEGNGHYSMSPAAANGRVFVWIAPVQGKLQGNYEPIRPLIAPNRLQLLEAGFAKQWKKNRTLSVKVARSQWDKNTFSTLDKANDVGYGLRVEYSGNEKWNQERWLINEQFSYEYTDARFKPIERYRAVEFDRIWNRLLSNPVKSDTGYTEQIVQARISAKHNQMWQSEYGISWYQREAAFNGIQHRFTLQRTFLRSQWNADAEWTTTQADARLNMQNNSFMRIQLSAEIPMGPAHLSVRSERESSGFHRQSDSLYSGSYLFYRQTASIRNADTTRFQSQFSIQQRNDFGIRNGEFSPSSDAWNATWQGSIRQKNGNRFRADITYRIFQNRDTLLVKQSNEQLVLSRIEYDYSLFHRFIQANSYWQLGSGNEWKRDFQYIEVAVGQGQYLWKDLNNDNQQQLNEFYPASYNDRNLANYIRVYLPSNAMVRTQNSQFSQTLTIQPALLFPHGFWSKWYNQSAFKLDQKVLANSGIGIINPLVLPASDTQLVSAGTQVRNTLFFNRNNALFGADYSYQRSAQKNLQTNGSETRTKAEHSINLRWNFARYFTLNSSFMQGFKIYESVFFNQNAYDLRYRELKPKCSYQWTQRWQISVWLAWTESRNQILGNESCQGKESGFECRGNIGGNGLFTAKFSLVDLQYQGKVNSSVAYEMLQGLRAGKNELISAQWQQRLGKNIQMNLNMDARFNGNQVIQTGKAEVRYLF